MGRLLAQVRPVDTDSMTVFSGAAQIDRIVVCNTTASAVTHQIFHDPAGDNYKEETALFFDVSIAAKATAEHTFDPAIETAPPAIKTSYSFISWISSLFGKSIVERNKRRCLRSLHSLYYIYGITDLIFGHNVSGKSRLIREIRGRLFLILSPGEL